MGSHKRISDTTKEGGFGKCNGKHVIEASFSRMCLLLFTCVVESVELLGGISAGVLKDDFLSLIRDDGAMSSVPIVQMHSIQPSISFHSHNHEHETNQQKCGEGNKLSDFSVFECPRLSRARHCRPWCVSVLSEVISVLIHRHGQQTYLATGMVVQEGRDVVDFVVDDHPAVVLLSIFLRV